MVTASQAFKTQHTAYKQAIASIQRTGSPIAFRNAVRAMQAMQALFGHTYTLTQAESLVIVRLNCNYHPFN